MMGWIPGCYIPSFVEIDLSVPEKKTFDRFLPYRGVAAILAMLYHLGYTPLNIHEIWLRLLLGEHLLYIRAKMTSFVNSLD